MRLEYALTIAGLVLELAGAFLLSAEAIGREPLARVADLIRRRRKSGFAILVLLSAGILMLVRWGGLLELGDALVLLLVLGLFYDFGPRWILGVLQGLERGTAGWLGFLLFALGFLIQAVINLSHLRGP